MKKSLVVTIIMFLIMVILGGSVNAASASVGASSKTVSVGENVSITVSFGEKVKMAEFELSYDKTMFEYVSSSKGAFQNRFSFVDSAAQANTESVTLTFKAKTKGTGTFKVSNLKIATATQRIPSHPMSNASVSVTVQEATTSNSGGTNSSNTGSSSKKTSSSKNKSKSTKSKTNSTTQTEEGTTGQEGQVELAPNELIMLDAEGVVTLEDPETKVMVKGLPNAIDDDVELKVEIIEEDDENYEAIEDILKEVDGKKTYYDIQLLKNGEPIQPNGYVTVFIPIPEEYNKEQVESYYVDIENKDYELVKGRIQENYQTFTTDHFSTYALVEREEMQAIAEPEEEKVSITQMIADFFKNVTNLYIIIAILIVIIIILAIKKNKAKHA